MSFPRSFLAVNHHNNKNFLKKKFKFYGLVLGLVGLIDAKGVDVAQSIQLRDWPT